LRQAEKALAVLNEKLRTGDGDRTAIQGEIDKIERVVDTSEYTVEQPDAVTRSDTNWALGQIINRVYPELIFTKKLTADEAAFMAADLVLLTRVYDDLRGFELQGPLNPFASGFLGKGPQILDSVINAVTLAQVELRGGSTGISGTEKFTIFKTYNPVLFELTRLFWPTGGRTNPQWSNILAHDELVTALDTVGVFGATMQLVQEAGLKASNQQEVLLNLQDRMRPAFEQQLPGTDEVVSPSAAQVLRGWRALPYIKGVRYTKEELRAPAGWYTPLLLTWPLGLTSEEYNKLLNEWLVSPVQYLKHLKPTVANAIRSVMSLRNKGFGAMPLAELNDVIGDISRGRQTLDPESPADLDALNVLSSALEQALPEKGLRDKQGRAIESRGFGAMDMTRRKREEKKALAYFQQSPGRVKIGKEMRQLPAVQPTGVYDAKTLALLEQHRQAARGVAGALEPVFPPEERRTAQGLIVTQGPLFAGKQTPKLRGSVIAEAQRQEAIEFQADMRAIDKRIKMLDASLGAAKPSTFQPSAESWEEVED